MRVRPGAALISLALLAGRLTEGRTLAQNSV
jgi:hypothetical protein